MLRSFFLCACATFISTSAALAGEPSSKDTASATTTEEEPTYNNWINLVIGGVAIDGDAAQFKQEHRISGDFFGGIEDMHYEHAIGKDGQLLLDGRAIFDNHDYNVRLELNKAKLGYIRAGYNEFRSWYDGNAAYFPVNGAFFEPPFQEMHVDRGEAFVELGLRLPNFPEITLHYSHLFRDGMKDSTVWGDTIFTGLPATPTNQRKITPAFRGIDETRDIFAAEITHTIGKTDLALGMRYEHSLVDNTLNLWRAAGQVPPFVAAPGAERLITQHDRNELDNFNGHVTTETRLTDKLYFTTGYSYTTLSSDISGSRVIGPDYDVAFGTPFLRFQSNDHQVVNLSGMSDLQQHVGNLNLMWLPIKDLTALAAFRYTHENTDSASSFLDYNTAANTAPFTPTNPRNGFHVVAPTLRAADTSVGFDNFAQTFELRFTGLSHILLYARGDWEEEDGDVHEHEATTVTDFGMLNKDTSLFFQKYSVGANWYPLASLNLSAQYYHKSSDYENDFHSELATQPVPGAERNQRLLNREIDTDNVNLRLTWHPHIPAALGTLGLVARYDYTRSEFDTQWGISPTAVGTPPTNTIFDSMRSGTLTYQSVSGTVTWNPMPRLYLQGTGSYVWNKTDTPSDYVLVANTQVTVLDSHNDYWQVGGSLGFVIDDKTNLHADYNYYCADNYENNALSAVPYGSGQNQHTFSASLDREITKNIRLSVKYTYFDFTDQLSGGHNNYTAHAVFSGLQFRF